MNRAFHGVDSTLLERNYIAFLKSCIGNHRVMFIVDDTLLEHVGSKVMEQVEWFFDRASGNNALAHQPVTSGIYDLDAGEFYPLLMRLYKKKHEDDSVNFMTKLEIMEDIFHMAESNFNVTGKVVDSCYSSFRFLGKNYVTELKSDRKASFHDFGKMTGKNRDMFYIMNEIVKSTFLKFERDSDIL